MGDMSLENCLIYLDDIVVFSSTFEEHIERFEAVFSRLQINTLKLNASKCEFFKLGHVVSEQGICTDPSKKETVLKLARAQECAKIRIF